MVSADMLSDFFKTMNTTHEFDSTDMFIEHIARASICQYHIVTRSIVSLAIQWYFAVNVDNKENRKKKRGRAVLLDNGVYYVVGDDGVQRKL